MKILIVEDELIPANYLKKVLLNEGYEVIGIAKRGDQAIALAKSEKPDLIFMDVMLQDKISGADAAVEIHYSNPNILIIFLTAFSDQEMIEFAVRSEAFAYLLKPYRDDEILATLQLAKAKIKARTFTPKVEPKEAKMIALVDGYSYHQALQRVFLNEKEIELGPKALQLIKLLCENKNITLEIDDIIQHLWDEPKSKQTLRSLIHRIRQMTSAELIQNVNKFGYRIGLK
ncbi:response regulator [bacterium]|nr:response regulator [bacterium]MBU1957972.1 response regulator [bacterium]